MARGVPVIPIHSLRSSGTAMVFSGDRIVHLGRVLAGYPVVPTVSTPRFCASSTCGVGRAFTTIETTQRGVHLVRPVPAPPEPVVHDGGVSFGVCLGWLRESAVTDVRTGSDEPCSLPAPRTGSSSPPRARARSSLVPDTGDRTESKSSGHRAGIARARTCVSGDAGERGSSGGWWRVAGSATDVVDLGSVRRRSICFALGACRHTSTSCPRQLMA